jgi:carbon-monoxide dehydrogenase small subunit/glyceraldehyde dehydrogenase small subunit
VSVRITLNGETESHDIEPRVTLAEFVRSRGLTGTKVSCEMQVCGACTVLVDGLPVSSCTYLAVDCDGREVLTIEGVADGAELHPLQQSFIDHFALQCGFCTPGFVMSALALLETNPSPTRDEVVHHLEGNMCRCTGYRPIIDAVMAVVEEAP